MFGDSSFQEVLSNDDENHYKTHPVFQPIETIRLSLAKRKSLNDNAVKLQGSWLPFRPEEPIVSLAIKGLTVKIVAKGDWEDLTGEHILRWPSMIVLNDEQIGLMRAPAEGIFVGEDGEVYVDSDSAENGLLIARESTEVTLLPTTEQVAEPDL